MYINGYQVTIENIKKGIFDEFDLQLVFEGTVKENVTCICLYKNITEGELKKCIQNLNLFKRQQQKTVKQYINILEQLEVFLELQDINALFSLPYDQYLSDYLDKIISKTLSGEIQWKKQKPTSFVTYDIKMRSSHKEKTEFHFYDKRMYYYSSIQATKKICIATDWSISEATEKMLCLSNIVSDKFNE